MPRSALQIPRIKFPANEPRSLREEYGDKQSEVGYSNYAFCTRSLARKNLQVHKKYYFVRIVLDSYCALICLI